MQRIASPRSTNLYSQIVLEEIDLEQFLDCRPLLSSQSNTLSYNILEFCRFYLKRKIKLHR